MVFYLIFTGYDISWCIDESINNFSSPCTKTSESITTGNYLKICSYLDLYDSIQEWTLFLQRLNHTKITLIKVNFAKMDWEKRNGFHKYDSITEKNYIYFWDDDKLVEKNY